jgi:hypothetical protein
MTLNIGDKLHTQALQVMRSAGCTYEEALERCDAALLAEYFATGYSNQDSDDGARVEHFTDVVVGTAAAVGGTGLTGGSWGNAGTPGGAPVGRGAKLDKAIRAYMAQHPGVDYPAAMLALMEGGGQDVEDALGEWANGR